MPRAHRAGVDRYAPAESASADGRRQSLTEVIINALEQRLWFLEQLDSEGISYLPPWALRLRAPREGGALPGAFGALPDRHPKRRPRHVDVAGTPVVVDDASDVRLSITPDGQD